MKRFALTLPALVLATATFAQEVPNTILVLDGSGSMWGQIDGVNKIVIAREVVAEILADFPGDQNLGLTVYGHRTRGDCADIETLIAPAPGTAQAIIDAVNAISPRGMTPMTDAVIAAAEQLRYTENAATVILVSDGIETCNPDPCAAARALEEAGIGFTAHVVGFDVGSDPAALAQMQCIADETGGLFLTAANATELSVAMAAVAEAVVTPDPVVVAPEVVVVEPEVVVVAPEVVVVEPEVVVVEPEPGPVTITFQAMLTDGAPIDEAIVWAISGADGPISDDLQASGYETDLDAGQYIVSATRPSDGAVVEVAFTVGIQSQVVTAEFDFTVPKAALTAPDSAPAGSRIEVGWTGPDDDFDNIMVTTLEGERTSLYIYTSDGNPVTLTLPAEPGDYLLAYRWRDATDIATRPITVTAAELALMAPDSAPAGSTIDVGWLGPNAQFDNIEIGVPGVVGYSDFAYVTDGNPVQIILPAQPGVYELRYRFMDAETILSRPITVTEAAVTLTAPDTVAAGSDFIVEWTGPAAQFDNIQIGPVGDTTYFDFDYVVAGQPLTLSAPGEPGEYELRYDFRDAEIIATRPITVSDIAVTVSGPASAAVGATVAITWVGPDADLDFIGVGLPGEDGYINYAYTSGANPANLEMPTEPGAYEIRYYLGNGNLVLASAPITVTALDIGLTVPATAQAGATIDVAFVGPGYGTDFIGVGVVGDDGYLNYVYASQGNPARLQMPVEPGDYEVRYYLGQDNSVLSRSPITVTALSITLVGPSTGVAGNQIEVRWEGPGYPDDFIAISIPGSPGYETYAFTNDGNPLLITLPDAPGDYELRYFIGQNNVPMASQPITVTAPPVK